MPDRETNSDKNAPGASTPQPGEDRTMPRDSDVAQQNDRDAQKGTASRPRGQTEEPDRTL